MKFMRVLAVCAVLLAGGCVSTRFEAPKLSIVSVSMMSADVFAQQFRIRLHVDNPNDRELPIESIEYELFLQGDSFAEGTSDAAFVVPARGEAEFDTVVRTHFMSSVARLLTKLPADAQVQYDFTGKVHLSKGFMRNIPFNERGTVELGLKR